MHIKNHLIRKATLLFIFVTLGFASCKAAIPIDTTAPSSVTNLQAKSLEGKILLTWTDPADSDLLGIKIYNGQESTARSVSLNDGILVGKGIQKYEIANLEDGKKYTFKVSAVDLAGNESPIVTSEPVKFALKVTTEYVDVVITKYVCPKDSKVYDTAEEAADCCGVQIEYVKKHICPKCKKEFDTVEEAVKCFNTVVTETTNADGSKTITSTESKADGTKTITVEDIVDGKTVKTSVSEVAIDGSKKISDTYSSGITVKTSVTDTGTITTSAKNKDDLDINLTHFELPFNEWGPNYQKVIPISDLVNTEDIILGDVLKLHMTGVLEHDSKEIETYIVSTAPEDSYWSILSPIQSDDNDRSVFVFAENKKSGSSFEKNYEMPVVKIMESTNFSDVYLCFKASLRENEDADTHEDYVTFMVNISAELDKTNRISPITVTINPAGGICNKTSFSAFPGYNLKVSEIKKDKMFLNGWKDSQGNFVQKVPASDILLTAEWTDRLDLTKYGVSNPWDGNLYHINGNILYQYPDAVLVVEFSHTTSIEWPYGSLAVWGNTIGWNVLSDYGAHGENHTEDIVFKHLISDVISSYPNIEYVFLNQFESSKGFTVNGFYLDYKKTNIEYKLFGGTMDTTQETLPAGTPLERIPLKDGVLFGGWVDENYNPVTVAPEEDCTLYATWGDKLDISSLVNHENTISTSDLEDLYSKYPNAYLGFTYNHIAGDTDTFQLMFADPWDVFLIESPDELVNERKYSLTYLVNTNNKLNAKGIHFSYSENSYTLDEVFLTYNNSGTHIFIDIDYKADDVEVFYDMIHYFPNGFLGNKFYWITDFHYTEMYLNENSSEYNFRKSWANPVRDGFIFDGYYLDEGFSIPCGNSEGTAVTITEDLKLYVKWLPACKITVGDVYLNRILPGAKLWMEKDYNGNIRLYTSYGEKSTDFAVLHTNLYLDEECTVMLPTSEESAITVYNDLKVYVNESEFSKIIYKKSSLYIPPQVIDIIPIGTKIWIEKPSDYWGVHYNIYLTIDDETSSGIEYFEEWSYDGGHGYGDAGNGLCLDPECTIMLPTSEEEALTVTGDLILYPKENILR